jgi:NAD(P)-dependent dehydrogenase (short-subunit alcohol dehydrogenase family)
MSNIDTKYDFHGKVILVIGGLGLIGSEICDALLKANACIIVADAGVTELHVSEGQLYYRNLDIVNPDSVESLLNYCASSFQDIACVINTSYPKNGNYGRNLEDVEYTDFCENLNWHLGGYFNIMQAFGKFFKRQGYGNIINLASIYGVIAPKFEIYDGTNVTMPVEYAAIKSSIIHLSKYFAKYYQGNNIRVNCISPGGMFDGQHPNFVANYNEKCLSEGMLKRGNLIGSVLYLISDGSALYNGQNLIIDDGFSL